MQDLCLTQGSCSHAVCCSMFSEEEALFTRSLRTFAVFISAGARHVLSWVWLPPWTGHTLCVQAGHREIFKILWGIQITSSSMNCLDPGCLYSNSVILSAAFSACDTCGFIGVLQERRWCPDRSRGDSELVDVPRAVMCPCVSTDLSPPPRQQPYIPLPLSLPLILSASSTW